MQADLDLPLPTGIYSANSVLHYVGVTESQLSSTDFADYKGKNDKDVHK